MSAEGLTLEEYKRVIYLSLIPAIAIATIFAVYYGFVRLEQIYPPGSQLPDFFMLDFLLNMMLPMLVMAPTSIFLTFEILCHRITQSPARIHIKRFTGRMAINMLCVLTLTAIYLASYFLLAPSISQRYAMLSSGLLWSLLIGLIVIKFRHFMSRLEKGEW